MGYLGCIKQHTKIGFGEVTALLQETDINPDDPMKDGTTALYLAASNGNLEMLKTLLKKNANPNFTKLSGSTPLYIAAEYGHVAIVKELITKGAKVNAQRIDDGASPLFVAASNNQLETVKVLLANGANVHLKRKDGTTALHAAADNSNDPQLINILLSAGLDPNSVASGADGTSPLYVAAQQGNDAVVEVLLKNNGDPNQARSLDGATPLHAAIFNGHFNAIKLLLDAGANPLLSVKNITTLNFAENKDPQLQKLLLDRMYNLLCDPKYMNVNNRKQLLTQMQDMAEKNGFNELAQNLMRFSELENLAQHLLSVEQKYKPTNPERKQSLKNLHDKISQAYSQYKRASEEDVPRLVANLKKDALEIAAKAADDHKTSGALRLFGITKSRLNDHIQKAIASAEQSTVHRKDQRP